MHLDAKRNEYADAAGDLLDSIPKAVWAAIAVSALTGGGDRLGAAQQRVANEWLILWSNGIVPQKPPKQVRALAVFADREDGFEGNAAGAPQKEDAR